MRKILLTFLMMFLIAILDLAMFFKLIEDYDLRLDLGDKEAIAI